MLGSGCRIIITLVPLLLCLGMPSAVDGAIVFEESQSGTALSTDEVTSASITGVNDHLYLASIGARSAHTVSSVSGLGLTWTEVEAQCAARETTSGISIWKAQGTVSGDGTVTATLDSNSDTLVLVVARYSGVNTTNPVGNFDSANTFGVDGACSGGTDSTGYSFSTLDTSQDDSMVFVAVNPRITSPSPGSGYTERDEVSAGSGGAVIIVAINDKPFATTTTDLTVDGTIGTARDWAVLAIEIMDASATAITLTSLDAVQQGDGVLLQWRTGYESDNLGFHVHREMQGQLTQLTPSLIAGSALMVGSAPLTAGRSYAWRDQDGTPEACYWLEDVDLYGTRTWHGPVYAVPGDTSGSGHHEPVLLSNLSVLTGTQQSRPHMTQGMGPGTSKSRTSQALEATPPTSQDRLGKMPDGDLDGVEIQRSLAAQPAVKISVKEDGWYRVSQPTLMRAGLDPDLDPRFIQLFADGQEEALIVMDQRDGRFDAWDTIEFFGRALDTPWSGTRIYWLIAGSHAGKRIRKLPGPFPGARQYSFSSTVERKENSTYFAALKNGESDNFFGPVIADQPLEQSLIVFDLQPSSQSESFLHVALQGATQVPHDVTVLLNQVAVGSIAFWGQKRGEAIFALEPGMLREGKNAFQLIAQSGNTDVSLVDFIRLTYGRSYRAEQGRLWFSLTGGRQARIEGFTSPQMRIIDVTDPTEVVEVSGMQQTQGPGSFAVTITAPREPDEGKRQLLAFTDARVLRPAAVVANRPSAWHLQQVGAELVVIGHRAFLSALEPLRALREAEGWSVAVIDVEDLYDEFSFGTKTPWAIREFLLRASEDWQQPPGFVLLMGDASLDPRNYLGLGDFDFLPTKLIGTAFLETASDDWFADFADQGLPKMAIGRLPVRTVEQAETVVAKIVGYAQQDSGTWANEVLLVADTNDGFDFEAATAELRDQIPSFMTVREVLRGRTDDDAARAVILRSLNEGKLLVNYTGHASVSVWQGDLLSSDDANTLTNGSRLPLMITMNCLNGFFHDLFSESLAEAFLKAEGGGAVAVFASSGLTGPQGQAVMNVSLLELLFGEEELTLGEAVVRAKGATRDSAVRRTWILFGDPTLKLH